MTRFWNLFFRTLAGAILWPVVRVKVIDRRNLPKGPFVLVAGSHTTEIESPIIAIWLWLNLRFYAKQELWRNRFLGWVLGSSGQIPVARSGVREDAEKASIQAVQALQSGAVFGVFPEGTRARDGLVHAGHPGFVYVALRSDTGEDTTLVPVGLKNMRRCFRWQFGGASIRVGSPVTIRRIRKELGLPDNIQESRLALAVTEYMMRRIAEITDGEYSSKRLTSARR